MGQGGHTFQSLLNGPHRYAYRLAGLLVLVTLLTYWGYLNNRDASHPPSHSVLHLEPSKTENHYGGDPTVESSKPLIQSRLDALKLKLDPRLQRSAEHVLKRVLKQRSLVSSEALNFYLNSAGAVYWDTEQVYLETERNDETAFLNLLAGQRQSPHGFGGRIGLAEKWDLFPHPRRRLLALIAHPRIILDRLPRMVGADRPIKVSGRIVKRISQITVHALNQNGVHISIAGQVRSGAFEVGLALESGQWTVELVGETDLGPMPLAQFQLGVGMPPVTVLKEGRPHLPSISRTPSEILTTLINESRAQFGLPTLTRNLRLDDVAARHTMEMVHHGFVGHHSPFTGDVSQRLQRHHIQPEAYGENIARNTSLLDVHRSLMHSVSHRINILDPEFTDLGLGIRFEDGEWWVTELYARMENQVGFAESAD